MVVSVKVKPAYDGVLRSTTCVAETVCWVAGYALYVNIIIAYSKMISETNNYPSY